MSFFAEIARFAIKGLIVVAIFFLATLAVIAAFALGGSGGGGDYAEEAARARMALSTSFAVS